jgi:hypothetical protein
MELEAERPVEEADVEDERLIEVSEERDRFFGGGRCWPC